MVSTAEKGVLHLLQVKKLQLIHKKDYRVLLEDFNFVLNAGDKAVIIGEEGNGKSTLLKWIFDPEMVEDYVQAQGERICTGEQLGYLPQELPLQDQQKSLYEFFSEEACFWEQTPKELSKLAKDLQLPADFFYSDQKLGTLSGGEKVKTQLARLLMASPTALLLDEPSNDLDLETLEWLEKWIAEAVQPIIFISHDEVLIERTANVIVHIEQLKRKTQSRYTVARMDYETYLQDRGARLSNQEQLAFTQRREEKIRQEKLRRIQQKVEHDQNTITRQNPHGGYLLKKKMKAVKSMERRFERAAEEFVEKPETEDAIFLKFGENIRIPAGKTVLEYRCDALYTPGNPAAGTDSGDEGTADRLLAKDLFLRVKGGEKVCIIGKNGAGKTTLLKQIAEELLAREDILAAYMPQNYEDLLDMALTPVEFLAPSGKKTDETQVRTYLGSMKYTADEMNHPIAELSGGQKAKVLLLKMSLSGADVLILDEPTRNFSPLSGPVIREVLASFGGAIISVSHDRKYIEEVCDSLYRFTPEGLEKVFS